MVSQIIGQLVGKGLEKPIQQLTQQTFCCLSQEIARSQMPQVVAEVARSSIPVIAAGVVWITPEIIGEGASKIVEFVMNPDGN